MDCDFDFHFSSEPSESVENLRVCLIYFRFLGANDFSFEKRRFWEEECRATTQSQRGISYVLTDALCTIVEPAEYAIFTLILSAQRASCDDCSGAASDPMVGSQCPSNAN